MRDILHPPSDNNGIPADSISCRPQKTISGMSSEETVPRYHSDPRMDALQWDCKSLRNCNGTAHSATHRYKFKWSVNASASVGHSATHRYSWECFVRSEIHFWARIQVGQIYQCTLGHELCGDCWKKVPEQPKATMPELQTYPESSIQNLAVERLADKEKPP